MSTPVNKGEGGGQKYAKSCQRSLWTASIISCDRGREVAKNPHYLLKNHLFIKMGQIVQKTTPYQQNWPQSGHVKPKCPFDRILSK